MNVNAYMSVVSDRELARALAIVSRAIGERGSSDVLYGMYDSLRTSLLGVDDLEPLLDTKQPLADTHG